MCKVFTEETIDFMQNKMCINPQIYIDKISSFNGKSQMIFKELGALLQTTGLSPNMDIKSDPLYLEAYYIAQDKLNKSEFEVAEVFIDSFMKFKKYGLLELYRLSESDIWFPLPIITFSLHHEMKNIDIEELDKKETVLTIYRGTSHEEFETKGKGYNGEYSRFSQSWTLSLDIAKKFAFELGKEKYRGTERVVMKAKINKSYIFAYLHTEEECIINSGKIINERVEVVESGIFRKVTYK